MVGLRLIRAQMPMCDLNFKIAKEYDTIAVSISGQWSVDVVSKCQYIAWPFSVKRAPDMSSIFHVNSLRITYDPQGLN